MQHAQTVCMITTTAGVNAAQDSVVTTALILTAACSVECSSAIFSSCIALPSELCVATVIVAFAVQPLLAGNQYS